MGPAVLGDYTPGVPGSSADKTTHLPSRIPLYEVAPPLAPDYGDSATFAVPSLDIGTFPATSCHTPRNMLQILLSLGLGAAGAMAQTSFAKDCVNTRLQSGWLIGDCLTSDGQTRITSSTYLPSKVTNHEASLEVSRCCLASGFSGSPSYTYADCIL